MRALRSRGSRAVRVATLLALALPALASGAPPGASRSADGTPSLRFDPARRELRITPVPSAVASDPSGASAASALQLCALETAPGETIALDGVGRPAGWSLVPSVSGRGACLVATAGAAPLVIALANDRDHVTARFERAMPGGAAVVELAGQTRLVELSGAGEVRVELGRGVALHAWRDAEMMPYERSLQHDAGFIAASRPAAAAADPNAPAEGTPYARRFVLDRRHALDPYPVLPAAVATLPLEVTYPEVFVPRDGELRLGIALAPPEGAPADTSRSPAAPVSVRVEARFVPLAAAEPSSHAVTVLAGRDAQPASLPLATGTEGPGTLTVRVAAVDPAQASARLELIDPLIRGAASVVPRRPNVVVVTLDTVRADHLSLYGYHRPTTPFLGELARDARIFDAAYSQITNTRPSHFSLFTGRYSGDIGIWNNDGPPLPERELTLAEVMRSAGWATGAVVSVDFLGPQSGLGQGFDEMLVPPSGLQPVGAETTRGALDFIRRHAHEPFFLWAHYFDAHVPYQPVPELRGLFWQGPPPAEENVDRTLIPAEFFDGLFVLPHVQYMTAMYDASLRYLDDQLRTLFTTLRETGLLDDTIVVITADHGESLGDHGIYFVHAGLYEPTVHVPLLIHAPRSQARPGRVSRVVENLDIPATVFDLTGLARPASFRGDSLMKDEPGDDAAFFEHYGRFATGMRRGTVKTIDSRELKNHRDKVWPSLRVWYEAPSLEMFDLARDPGELHDLGAEQAEALRANVGVLDAWRADRAQRQAVGSKVDKKLTETLRALGYVE